MEIRAIKSEIWELRIRMLLCAFVHGCIISVFFVCVWVLVCICVFFYFVFCVFFFCFVFLAVYGSIFIDSFCVYICMCVNLYCQYTFCE